MMGKTSEEDRYLRQRILPEIGEEGQRCLAQAKILVVGCGALGTNIAEVLARAGIGRITLVDDDRIELPNLQRQVLMTEADVGRPKARAVAEALAKINSQIEVTHEVARVEANNVERLIEDVDLVLDGFDNLPSRYLLNDACVKHRIPWVFAAVAGTYGMTMPILAGEGPCLRCLFPRPAPEKVVLTAGNAGILNTLPRVIAAIQTTQALKILLGALDASVELITVDIWQDVFNVQQIPRNEKCPCCGEGRYEFLEPARVE